MYACRICAVNYWYRAYYNLGQNAADNESFTPPSCELCPQNARCGGGLCLPVPMMGYWSQGVDRSTTNPDGKIVHITFLYSSVSSMNIFLFTQTWDLYTSVPPRTAMGFPT